MARDNKSKRKVRRRVDKETGRHRRPEEEESLICGNPAVIRRVPWQERGCPIRLRLGKLWRSLKDVGQIFVRIQAVFLCALDNAEGSGTGFRAIWGVCEQKILPVDHKRFDAALGNVVAGIQVAVQKIIHDVWTLVMSIGQCFAEFGFG